MINSFGKNGKPFIINLQETTRKNLIVPFIVGTYGFADEYKLSSREYVRIVYMIINYFTPDNLYERYSECLEAGNHSRERFHWGRFSDNKTDQNRL